jgi:hypothetical protein
MSYATGITGTAVVNSNDFSVVGWRLRNPGTILMFINSKTGLHPARQATITDLTFEIDFDFDPSMQPLSTSYNIIPGYAITSADLFINQSTPLGWHVSSGLVTEILQSSVRAGKVVSSFLCAINGGLITPPGGTAY